MKRVYGLYDDDKDNEITPDMMLHYGRPSDRKEWVFGTFIGVLIAGVIIGPFIFFGIRHLQNVKTEQEITKTINVIPTDKLDAECFATDIVTGDSGPSFYRALSIDNVYCKPNTESLNIKNRRGIGTTIYEGDESNQILYYKEFKEGNNIFYFNIRERN